MNTTRLKTWTAFAGAFVTAFSLASGAAAGSFAGYAERPYQTNYAVEEAEAVHPAFQAFDMDEEHELNDAWMAMPVEDSSGKIIGVVDDAFTGDDGEIESVLVTLSSTGRQIIVDGDAIYLTETAAVVDGDAKAVASAAPSPQ
jgi:hypothetical protein